VLDNVLGQDHELTNNGSPQVHQDVDGTSGYSDFAGDGLLLNPPARTILQRFGQMGGGDRLVSRQVGDRAGQFKHAMVATCRYSEPAGALGHLPLIEVGWRRLSRPESDCTIQV